MTQHDATNDSDPQVSVILCVFNRPAMVDAAIRSVRAQDHPSFELLVMDDASTDETPEILRRHAAEDPRVRVFFHERNVGQTRLINVAHGHARGEHIGWIDSDDLLLPDCLSATAAVLDARPEVGCVYTDQMIIDEHNRPLGYGRKGEIPYSPRRLLVDFMAFHFRLYRAELWAQVGGLHEDFPHAADYDFVLRLSEVAEFEHLPRPLYLYRQHANTVSSAKRLLQINGSADAVRAAMERRGMDQNFRLDVELISRFRIVPLEEGEADGQDAGPLESENDPSDRPGRSSTLGEHRPSAPLS